MISFACTLPLMIGLILACRREPAFLFVSAFLAWQFALKLMATTYLDVFGPVYSDEVFVWVGGHGASTPLMALMVTIPLVALWMSVRGIRVLAPPPPEPHLRGGGFSLADLGIWVMLLYLLALYVDMIRIGDIPLFTGKERFDYEGGIFHQFLVSYFFLIGFIIGYIVARERFVTGIWDARYAFPIILLFLYLLLTGHRFGGYYVLATSGLMPFAIFRLGSRLGIPAAPVSRSSLGQRLIRSRPIIAVLALTLLMFVAVGMANSLLYVRDNAPADALVQRFFVQPAHLYYLSWERVTAGEISGIRQVYDFLRDPFDPTRNTGIQYLMYLHLGSEQAYQIYVRQDVDYAGGYPEIFLEMGGVWFTVIVAILLSAFIGALYRICILAVLSGRLITAILSFYLSWSFSSVFLSGMIEAFAAKSFWLKLIVFAIAYFYERSLERAGKRLVPWILVPSRA